MSDATVRAAIKARLDSFGTIMGRVHDYERWAVDTSKFLAQFQDPRTKKIFGWEIVRKGFRTEKATMSKQKLIHRFMIRGYYGLSDADQTEKIINALVDQIVLSLIRNKLSGTQGNQYPEGRIDVRMFGSVLCHVAEITLPEITEIIDPLPEDGEVDLLSVDLTYYLKPGDDVADGQDVVDLTTS